MLNNTAKCDQNNGLFIRRATIKSGCKACEHHTKEAWRNTNILLQSKLNE